MLRSGHLKDAQLLDCYMAERAGDTLDPRHVDHLGSCGSCRSQFAELAAFLDGVRDVAEEETDEVFSPEQLEEQQRQIAARLEHVHRSARVISFPNREATPAVRAGSRVTARWLAAAAAAGLFIGVAVGGYLGPDRIGAPTHMAVAHSGRTSSNIGTQRQEIQSPAVRINASQPAVVPDDDAFLMDLELALARQQPRELQAFDALTPHVRDIR